MEQLAEKINQANCKKCANTYDVSHVEIFTLATCPRCGTKNTAPGKIDDLMLVEIIGSGGMGVIYRAVDLMLHREVVVKLMRPLPGGKFAASIQGSLQEARAQARINHPNVVQIHTIIWHGEQPCIVMELVSGGTAHQLINKSKPPDETRVLQIAIDITRGLEATWKAKIVYGDVKPSNILLTDEGVAKLADFGLSRMARGPLAEDDSMGSSIAGASSMGGDDAPSGTATYVAPEVAKRKLPDFRSDIYSLGITLFQLLTGDAPFQGLDKKSKIAARMNGIVPQVSAFRNVHPKTNAVVAKMMSFYPDMRYQSHADLIADLQLAINSIHNDSLVTAISTGSAAPAQVAPGAATQTMAPPPPLPKKGLAARMLKGATGALNRAIGATKPEEKPEQLKMGELRRYDPDPRRKQ